MGDKGSEILPPVGVVAGYVVKIPLNSSTYCDTSGLGRDHHHECTPSTFACLCGYGGGAEQVAGGPHIVFVVDRNTMYTHNLIVLIGDKTAG